MMSTSGNPHQKFGRKGLGGGSHDPVASRMSLQDSTSPKVGHPPADLAIQEITEVFCQRICTDGFHRACPYLRWVEQTEQGPGSRYATSVGAHKIHPVDETGVG